MYTVKVKLESNEIELPQYETPQSSGMDLRAFKYALPADVKTILDLPEEGFVLLPLQRVLITSGIKLELPQNTEIQVRPRSGLALKNGITCANAVGTVDEDYRNDVGVILLNTSDKPFVIKKGDRIAQIVLMPVLKFDWEVVEELSSTKRGEGGFGSTGVK